MMSIIKFLFGLITCYLIGSIPTAYLFGWKLKGIDIRHYGSGNVGATNAIRVLGKGPGSIVLLADALKGLLAVVVLPLTLGFNQVGVLVLFGMTAVFGHIWTVFLHFKGGKGIATSLGVLIGLMILVASLKKVVFLTLLIWTIVFVCFGYVSLASILAAVSFPLLMIMFPQPFEIVILGVTLCLTVVLKHRSNISRILSGQEPRVFFSFLQKPRS